MKRVYSIILLLLLAGSLFCQPIVNISSTYHAQVAAGGGGYSAEYQAVYDLLDTKPGADTATAQNTLVTELKTAGVWAKGDLLYVFAQRTIAGAYLMWLDPDGDDNITNVSATVFTKYSHFVGDGTADYLNTNWNPTTEAVNFAQDNCTVAIYIRNEVNEAKYVWGTGTNLKFMPNLSNTAYVAMNQSSTASYNPGGTAGMWVFTRASSTTMTKYKNGGSGTDYTVTSNAVANAAMHILASAGANFSTCQVSFFYVGSALNSTEATALNTAVEKYMDAIGVGVE